MATASGLQRGNYFIYNNEIVQVIRKELVNCGTHCHTKLKFFIKGLHEKGERTVNMAHQNQVEIVDITKKSGQVISKANDKVQVMDGMTYETLDASATKEVLDEIKEGDEVVFIDFNGSIQIIEKK